MTTYLGAMHGGAKGSVTVTITDGIKRQQTATDLHGYRGTLSSEWVLLTQGELL